MSERPDPNPGEITRLLREAARGDAGAESQLAAIVYPELLKLARAFMNRERKDHTLQPTALVNEVFLRLAGQDGLHWKNRSQFFATSATLMRHILVDHARERKAAKRAGDKQKVELHADLVLSEDRLEELLEIDDALARLSDFDPRQARIVELRFFGGLTEQEIADHLDVSVRTVSREWSMARAWLHGELQARAGREGA
ncbi:MAG: sigma-70 family RNA polymerase sigma factor [Bryobacteraceae bacterium]|nr:sigma-70 family RNA polymerase sigma factor [Bryobacteraceae bacterium]